MFTVDRANGFLVDFQFQHVISVRVPFVVPFLDLEPTSFQKKRSSLEINLYIGSQD